MKQAYEAWLPNADGLLEAAFRAFDMPRTKTADTTGFAILRETASLAQRARTETRQTFPAFFDIHINTLWDQGIFDAELSWHVTKRTPDGRTIIAPRLLEIGFLADPEGNVVIRKVQKHRLGLKLRSHTPPYGPLAEEKRLADWQLNQMRHHLRMRPEVFGLVATTVLLGTCARGGLLLFPTRDHHPEIAGRLLLYQISHPTNPLHLEEIQRILPLVDFAAMLRSIGVTDIKTQADGWYHMVNLSHVYACAERFFSDPTHPGRHRYVEILRSLAEAK